MKNNKEDRVLDASRLKEVKQDLIQEGMARAGMLSIGTQNSLLLR